MRRALQESLCWEVVADCYALHNRFMQTETFSDVPLSYKFGNKFTACFILSVIISLLFAYSIWLFQGLIKLEECC